MAGLLEGFEGSLQLRIHLDLRRGVGYILYS
jgi:hypothetical protein